MKPSTFDEKDFNIKIKGKSVIGGHIEVHLESTLRNVYADCDWILIDPLYKNSAIKIPEEHHKIFESSGMAFINIQKNLFVRMGSFMMLI
jgi:hypothetical protein